MAIDVEEEASRRLKLAIDGWSENVEMAREDVRFRHGDQWPEKVRKEREREGRPILTFNHMEGFIDQVVGDQLINEQTIKVAPVESKAIGDKASNIAGTKDYEIAAIYQGLIKNIEYVSRAKIAYNKAADHAAGHGFGYIRIATEYNDDDTFDQDIKIKQVPNAFMVYLDPASIEPDGSDANYVFISKWVDKDEYEVYQDKAPISNWGAQQQADEEWYEGDKTRLVEYYRKVKTKRTIALLEGGEVVSLGTDKKEIEANRANLDLQERKILKERSVDSVKVKYSLLSGGGEIKTGDWAGKYLPIIPVYGKSLNVDGREIYRGVIRHAKDAQLNYNYFETTATETIALAPKAPYVGTTKQFENYESIWQNANKTNYAYLPYDPDPQAPGAPQRQAPPQMSSGYSERIQSSRSNMMFTTGIQEAGLGARSNETSGKAITARQREGDVATFAFSDNKSISIAHVGRCLVDLIPKIYTKQRIIRVRNFDDTEDFVEINIPSKDGEPMAGGPEMMHDLGVGKYDVVVSSGPSFTTMREESKTAMSEMMNANPNLWPIMGDLVAEAMDWPNSDKIAERLRKQLPPGMLEKDEDEEEKPPTPEEEQQMQQQQAMQQMEQMKLDAEMAKAQADIDMAEAKKYEAKAKIAVAQTKLAEAGIDPMPLEQEIPQDPMDQYGGALEQNPEAVQMNEEMNPGIPPEMQQDGIPQEAMPPEQV